MDKNAEGHTSENDTRPVLAGRVNEKKEFVTAS
jgi:hypothetical protein